jgi:dienelactone hydrolase
VRATDTGERGSVRAPCSDHPARKTRGASATPIAVCLAILPALTLCAQEKLPPYAEHQDLSYYLDDKGQKQNIDAPEKWERRRRHTLGHAQSVMGPLPKPEKPVPLKVEVIEESKVGELVRRKIRYHTDSDDRFVHAYLFLPKDASKTSKVPAVLCLHQTTKIGKEEPAGLGGNPNLHYALHLAERGYVTLAPDYPSFGEYRYDFDPEHGYVSGTMKAIYDNVRAVDLLRSLPEIDPERIGCIGHSLGGHNAIFTSAFEPRIRCVVSNCGFTRFHKYYGGKLKGWTSPRYMPRIDREYHNSPDEVPFDFTELVAALAPRPFLASAPIRDDNFEVSGVKDVIAAAKPIYKLFGKEQNLRANYPDAAHDFDAPTRKVAYEFLDQHLKGK